MTVDEAVARLEAYWESPARATEVGESAALARVLDDVCRGLPYDLWLQLGKHFGGGGNPKRLGHRGGLEKAVRNVRRRRLGRRKRENKTNGETA